VKSEERGENISGCIGIRRAKQAAKSIINIERQWLSHLEVTGCGESLKAASTLAEKPEENKLSKSGNVGGKR